MPNNNPWLYFLQDFRKKHPQLKGASVMKAAAKLYKTKKTKKTKKSKKSGTKYAK